MIWRAFGNRNVQIVVGVELAVCVAFAVLEAVLSDWAGFALAVILGIVLVGQSVITYSAGRTDAMMVRLYQEAQGDDHLI